MRIPWYTSVFSKKNIYNNARVYKIPKKKKIQICFLFIYTRISYIIILCI